MQHNRADVIERTRREFELLDRLVAHLSAEEWALPVPRSETKEAWTVKDALAHITHWKASVARSARGLPRPPEERNLGDTAKNHNIYLRWCDSSPQEVLAWHRQVQQEVETALSEASEDWFSGRERNAEWPFGLDGHSATHRVRDIERALGLNSRG